MFLISMILNMLDSELIAPRWKGQKGPIIQLRVNIDQYIPLHLPHVSPQCRHIAAKQSAHIARATYIHFDHYCVGALRIIAHTETHALSAHICSLIRSDIQVYTKSYSYAVYWIGRCQLFPTSTMQCGNGPLLACHWWCYILWIHPIVYRQYLDIYKFLNFPLHYSNAHRKHTVWPHAFSTRCGCL